MHGKRPPACLQAPRIRLSSRLRRQFGQPGLRRPHNEHSGTVQLWSPPLCRQFRQLGIEGMVGLVSLDLWRGRGKPHPLTQGFASAAAWCRRSMPLVGLTAGTRPLTSRCERMGPPPSALRPVRRANHDTRSWGAPRGGREHFSAGNSWRSLAACGERSPVYGEGCEPAGAGGRFGALAAPLRPSVAADREPRPAGEGARPTASANALGVRRGTSMAADFTVSTRTGGTGGITDARGLSDSSAVR